MQNIKMHMQAFLLLVFALAHPVIALAQSSGGELPAGLLQDDQVEWAQRYEIDPSQSVQRITTPILSPQTYTATEQAVAIYQQIVAEGGWPLMPATQVLKLGSTGPSVVTLRRRLVIEGDLGPGTGSSPIFDSYVEAAVKRFQARHGLWETGVVSQATFDALNVPAQTRLAQLQLNLVRLKAFASTNLGERYVALNIPGARVETVENGVVITQHIAGVGKIDRQSPVMQTRALDINFNPYWTVPVSIIRKDLIPKMQANPHYLSENKIRVINKEGQEVAPSSINWNSMDAVNYKFRQDPGGDVNSLGVVRINIANPYGVYMHDTPAKGIFGDDFRFVSSGCVRLQNVRDYVAWLLKDTPGWSRDRIDEVIHSGERLDVKLSNPVNVYWVYVTAWASDGLVQFREDIYKRDGFGGPSPSVISAISPPASASGTMDQRQDHGSSPIPTPAVQELPPMPLQPVIDPAWQ